MGQSALDRQRVMHLCMETGRLLLINGGEIYRVQETMERMARAFGAPDFHVYVLTNGLFASVGIEGGDKSESDVAFVPASRVHLGRLSALNALSRDVENKGLTIEQALLRLEEIRVLPFLENKKRVIACAVGAASFSYLFGGTILDASVAFIAGLLLQFFINSLEKHSVNKIMYHILAAGLVAFVSIVFAELGAVLSGEEIFNIDKIIIGGIIPLVPGMVLTTAVRDFAGGDYLSGTIRLIDAIVVASSVAFGVGIVLMIADIIPGVII